MKRQVFLCALFAAICVCSGAQTSYKTAKDIIYSNADAYALERCRLDVYHPQDGKDCPVVVWFHGGGLTGGERYIPSELKESGIVVVSAGYRLLPKASIDQCIDDAAAAVAWTWNNVASFGGDPRKIFVAGHSAGGYLADLIGLDKHWLAKYGVDADSLRAIVPFSGQVVTHYNVRKLRGIKPTQPVIDEYAPLFHVRADAPPIVIISGDRNSELYGRYEETAYFWRMLQEVGHPDATIYELDGYDHGAMVSPGFHILKNTIRRLCR